MLSWFGCTVASQASRSLSATSSHKLLPTDFLQPCNHFHSTLFAIFNRPFCHFYSILLPFSLSLFAVFTQPLFAVYDCFRFVGIMNENFGHEYPEKLATRVNSFSGNSSILESRGLPDIHLIFSR